MKKAIISMLVWWIVLTLLVRDINFSLSLVLGIMIAIISIAIFDKD